MKKSLFAVLAFVFSLEIGWGQNLIPLITENGFSLQISGYGQGLWSDKTIFGDEHGRSLRWQSLVTRFDLKTPNPAITFFGEVELWGIHRSDANWLQKAYLQVRLSESLTFRFGRMLVARGYMTPAQDDLETVHYPRVPYGVYGTGIQMDAHLADGWALMAEVTGQTVTRFNDKDVFSKAEGAIRISKTFPKSHLSVGGMAKFAEGFRAYYLNSSWQPTKEFRMKGTIYAVDDSILSYSGGYVFAGFTLFEHVELHNQLDYRIDHGRNSSFIWTKGFRVCSKGHKEITVDHESFFRPNGEIDHQLFIRFERHF